MNDLTESFSGSKVSLLYEGTSSVGASEISYSTTFGECLSSFSDKSLLKNYYVISEKTSGGVKSYSLITLEPDAASPSNV